MSKTRKSGNNIQCLNQHKKNYLRTYRSLECEINRLLAERERWYALAKKITSAPSGMPKGKDSSHGKQENAVLKIAATEKLINKRISELTKMRKKIETAIAGMEDERLRLLLGMRYIDGMSFTAISVKMQLDERWVYRLHGIALSKLTIESQY